LRRRVTAKTGGIAIPIPLRPKARADVVRMRKRETIEAIGWLGLWALSLGFCAAVLAGIAYFLGGDNIGASFILIGAASIITLIVRASAEPEEHS
jgi:hypothetical protein